MIHKAKKSLGQNFLKSKIILEKIVEAGEVKKEDIILEIGPGKGALTEKLLEKSDHVIAIEKDNNLFDFLKEKFAEEIKSKKLVLINDDILKLTITDELFSDSPQKFSTENFFCPSSTLLPRVPSRTVYPSLDYKIIANIPYNITGAILKKFLTEKCQPNMMVLMVQNEVAKRIVARDGKESILSISVKAYGEPKMITKVPARYFSPAPKVDSAVILIKNIGREFFVKNKIDETIFWKIIHAGFAHKRKKLSGNLRKYIGPSYGVSLEEYKNKRAEDLSLEDWASVVKKL